jgi:arylsulfatase A-like enzyme
LAARAIVGGGSLLACALAALACSEPDRERPDVVVLMLDTLRPDHLELYGYTKPTAPFLASLGSRSAVFAAAYSTSSCTAPAVASIFTGLYPTRHGVYETLFAHDRLRLNAVEQGATRAEYRLNVLPSDTATLPERLQDLGYETFGFSSNPNVDRPMGFDRGFDHFFYSRRLDAAGMVEAVTSQLEALDRAHPRFVYVHFMDPHFPYHWRKQWLTADVSDPTRKPRGLARYDSEISFLDHHLERLFELLQIRDDTLVVIASDHGEAFGEHGVIRHGYGLNAELNDALLLIHGTALGIEPVTIDVNVSLIDILPTVLDAVGAPREPEIDGRSLVPLVRAGAADVARHTREFESRTLFAHRRLRPSGELTKEGWAAIRDRWKLIEDHGPTRAAGGEWWLYDRLADPGERADVQVANPDVARSLRASLDTFKGSVRESEWETAELSSEQIRQLRALGYADEAPPEDELP